MGRVAHSSDRTMVTLTMLFFLLVSICVAAARVSYDSYQVLRVTPTTADQIKILSRLHENDLIDVWTGSRIPNSQWDIMVSPTAFRGFVDTLIKVGLPWEVKINNVERVLQNDMKTARLLSAESRTAGDAFNHNKYLRYDEILKYIDSLAALGQKRNLNVTVETIGKSFENRSIKVLKIGATSVPSGAPRRAVFIDAGIHAREWIAPAAVLYVADQLITNQTASAEIINDTDFYIIPVLNPDGYEYTHTSDRMWRKTRSNKNMIGFVCNGVDANRNFGHHWREAGASWFPCSETYAGPKAFSEPEARALRDFLMAHKAQIKAYLTYHSYGNYLLYPWGYSNELPEDYKWLDSVAKQANAAMVAAGSGPYKVGSSSRVLYSAAGGSDDWAKAVAGIPLSYTIELPGGGSDGFNPPATAIVKTGRETLVGVFEFAKEVKTMK